MGRRAAIVMLGLASGCLPAMPEPAPATSPRPAAPAPSPVEVEVAPPPIDLSVLEEVEVVTAPDLTARPACTEVLPLRDVTDPIWGPVLHDLARHISHDGPWHESLVTAAHESTHLMNTQINREAAKTTSAKINGFYLLEDCAVILLEPAVRKADTFAYIPEELRGLRYAINISGQESWDDVPTYIFDEWIAYTHGSTAALELRANGNWNGRQDAMAGQVEFTIYSLALGMAVRDLDPTYFADQIAFKQLLAWNSQRALDQYRAGKDDPAWPSAEQDRLYEQLHTGAAGEPMRGFIRDTWGEEYLARLLPLL